MHASHHTNTESHDRVTGVKVHSVHVAYEFDVDNESLATTVEGWN